MINRLVSMFINSLKKGGGGNTLLISCESSEVGRLTKCDSKAETLIGRDAVFLVGSSSSLREQALTSPIFLVRKAGFVHH